MSIDRAGARLLAVALMLASCSKDKGAPPAPAASVDAAPRPTPSARRPARRYYLARTPVRCEIYFADPGLVSPPLPTPCPTELGVGERIRVAGKTCVHEGSGPDSLEPVVCPAPLTDFELEIRGEKRD